jgi:uncharacterized repeat protein (TIGR03803 family)
VLPKFLLPAAFLCCLSPVVKSQTNNFTLYGSYAQPVGGEGAVYAINPDGSDYRVVKAFPSNPEGQVPVGKFLLANDGFVYGVCQAGGTGTGTIFKVKTDGSEFQVIHTFGADFVNPQGGLVLGNDGYLFGATKAGAFNDGGIIYKVKTDGSGFTTVHEFGGTHLGRRVGLTVDVDGTIYGVGSNSSTNHAVFKLSADGASFNFLHHFTDMTSGHLVNGEILLASNGYLYGTSRYNGANERGTLFRVKKDGTSFSTLMDFPATFIESPEYNLVEIEGVIYGSAASSNASTLVFKVNLDGTGYGVVTNPGAAYGNGSAALAVSPDGNLIMVSRNAGPEVGVVSHINLDTNTPSVIGSFADYSFDAAVPVVLANGDIIGGRDFGYGSKNGCIYRMTSAGALTIFKEFPQPEGSQPMGNIVESDGFLYGVTQRGGEYGTGVIYQMKRDGSEYVVLGDIDKNHGGSGLSLSFNGPLLGSDGLLYGTNDRELSWSGSLYKIGTDGSVPYTEIYDFSSLNGEYPTGHLMEGSDGMLYGMTQNGGTNGTGTIYRISKAGIFQKLHDFASGTQVQGGTLVEGLDGYLVGIAPSGGTNSLGILFRIKMDGSLFEKVKDFDGTTGAGPMGGTLVKHPDGRLFGLSTGGTGTGTIFSLAGDGTDFQVEYHLNPSSATNAITIGVDGVLYGQTLFGAELFRINIDGTGYTTFPLLPPGIIDARALNANFLTSSKLPQTITFELAATATVLDPPITLTATSDSDLPVTFASSNTQVATVQGNILTIVATGEVTITATTPGNVFYEMATLGRTLTVTKVEQTITFEELDPATYGDEPIVLSASSSSALAIAYASSDEEVATVTGSTLTITGGGTATITASQGGNAIYFPAAPVSRDLVVGKAGQIISFEDIVDEVTGPVPFDINLQAASTSGLSVVFESSNTDVATVSGSTLSVIGFGATTITARQPGNTNFLAATEVTQELTVLKMNPQLTITSPRGGVAGAVLPVAVETPSSGAVTFALTNNAGIATIEGHNLTLTGPGVADLDVSITETESYQAASVHVTITVLRPRSTLEITTPDAGFVGEILPITANASGSGVVNYGFWDVSGAASPSGQQMSLDEAGIVTLFAYVLDGGAFRPTTMYKNIRIFNPDPLGNDTRIFGTTAEGGTSNTGIVYSLKTDGSDYRVHHDFQSIEGAPQFGNMIVASNGLMYGLTINGGLNNQGTIFEYDYVNNLRIPLFNFNSTAGVNPQGALLEASNGYLYGTTYEGGANNSGTLFKFELATSNYTNLFDFGDDSGLNSYSHLTEVNGKIYGATINTRDESSLQSGGRMFEHDLNTGVTTFFHHFDPMSSPTGLGLLASITKTLDGRYFGMTTTGSTPSIFEFTPGANTITKRAEIDYAFGYANFGRMVTAPNGKMYFLITFGGTSSAGSILQFDPNTYALTSVHSFSHADGGSAPWGSLTLAPNGKLYGFTSKGGLNSGGVIFEFDPSTLTYATKVNLGGSNGSAPTGQMVLNYDGKLYGIAPGGGDQNAGVLFAFDPNSGTFEKRLNGKGSPMGNGTQGTLAKEQASGKVYSSAMGGFAGKGLLYSLDPGNNAYDVAVDFSSQPSSFPFHLVQASNGKLYGTAQSSAPGNGIVYEFNGSSGQLTSIGDLTPTGTGAGVSKQLTEGHDGMLYGVATMGGANSTGTIFQVNPATGSIVIKHSFESQYGRQPATRLLLMPNGKFYGAMSVGGTNNQGSIYSWDPARDTYVVEKVLDATFFGNISDLVIGPGGKIWGLCHENNNSMKLFEFNPETLTLVNKHTMPTGGTPFFHGNLVTENELLIGSIRSSGDHGSGYIFSYKPDGDIFTVIKHFDGIDGGVPTGYHLSSSVLSQEIDFEAIDPKVYLDEPFELSATSTSGFPVTFASSDLTVATIEGSTVTIVGAGAATITASLPGSEFYGPATAERTLSVAKAEQVITFNSLTPVTLSDAPFNLTATASSELEVTYSVDNTSVATVSGNTVTIVAAGSAMITAHQAGSENYLAAEDVTTELLVNRMTQTISFDELTPVTFGDPGFELAATASSALSVVFSSSDESVASVTGNQVSIVGAGSANITASQEGNAQYLPAENVRVLVVGKAAQGITFGPLSVKKFNDDDHDLVATASSELPVTFESSNLEVATVSGSTVSIVGAGATTITALQPGNENFNAAAPVEQTLTVERDDQEITFGAVSSRTLGEAPFALDASSTSELPIAYSTASDKIIINGETVTMVKAGRLTVVASQEGDNNYEPAADVQQSFCINPAKPVITISVGVGLTLTSSNGSGNLWFSDGTAIPEADGQSYVPPMPGTYTVQTIIDDCTSEISEPMEVLITGLQDEVSMGMKVYPNPVLSELYVELTGVDDARVTFEVFDVMGHRISTTIGLTNSPTPISMEDHGPGMYLLKASTGERTHTSRVVKK